MTDVQLQAARADYARGDWPAAYAAWSTVELDALSVAELEDLAASAELTGHHDTTIAALQRAFGLCQADGDRGRAVPLCLPDQHDRQPTHGEVALAGGWTSRAEGLVEGVDDGVELGWVALLRMFRALGAGDFAHRWRLRRRGDRGRSTPRRRRPHGTGAVRPGPDGALRGPDPDGLARLDESMVRVIAGETSPSSPATSTAPRSRAARRSATSGAWRSGRPRSSAGVPPSRGCWRSRGSARSTAASCCGCTASGSARWRSSSMRPGATRRSAPRTPSGWRRTRPARS